MVTSSEIRQAIATIEKMKAENLLMAFVSDKINQSFYDDILAGLNRQAEIIESRELIERLNNFI